MAVNGNFFKLYNMMGNCRNLLSSRIMLPIYQPVAAMGRSVEESIGLPPKPKRPLSPYFSFMRGLRPSVVEKHPNLKLVEVTKFLAQEWQKADGQVKQKLQKEYDLNLAAYRNAKADYEKSLTSEQQEKLDEAILKQKLKKQKKLHKQVIQRLGKPKRPAASFAMWVRSLGQKRGSMALSEWQKNLVQKWGALPEKERETFEVKAAEAMKSYIVELRKWQHEMMKTGNRDLMRYGVQLNTGTKDKKEERPE